MSPICFVLIPNPETGAVLAYKDYQLPIVHHAGDSRKDLAKLCSHVEEVVENAFRLRLLRTECQVMVSSNEDDGSLLPTYRPLLLIFEISSDSSLSIPNDFIWVPRNEVPRISVQPRVSAVVQFLSRYTEKGLSCNGGRLHPYSQSGWFREAAAWITDKCNSHGCPVSNMSNIEQVSSKPEGCILRVDTKSGSLIYFKAIGPNVLEDELKVTIALSDVFPDEFYIPVDVEMDRRWMLLRDCGSTFSDSSISVATNPSLFRRILTAWGEIQKKSVSLITELQTKGLRRVTCGVLESMVQEMMSDRDWLMALSSEVEVLPEVILKGRFEAYLSRLGERLSEFNVPLALTHGDFCPINIASHTEKSQQFRYIDFGSTCISYPFRDAFAFAEGCNASEDDLQFYFDLWGEYESKERLRQLFRIVREFEVVFSMVVLYKQYSVAEESKRASTREEACTLVASFLSLFATQS